MKKLFLIAAAVALSFAASASTVTWGAAGASSVDSSKITAGTFYLMYASSAFDASKFTGETFSAATLAAAGLDTQIDTFAYSSTTYQKKNNAITPTSTGGLSGTKTVYEVLISSDGQYIAYGSQSISIAASAGLNQNKAIGSFTYVQASGGGTPEPTSGLLLLVGAGILGLRRKRA